MAATAPQPLDFAALDAEEAVARIHGQNALHATPFSWPDPASLPRRQWLLGHLAAAGRGDGHHRPARPRQEHDRQYDRALPRQWPTAIGQAAASQCASGLDLQPGGRHRKRGATETYSVLVDQMKGAKEGDLSHYRAMLAGQAISLHAIFTELSRRAALNMAEYLAPTETYMRLALKAQAQSRATIEALER